MASARSRIAAALQATKQRQEAKADGETEKTPYECQFCEQESAIGRCPLCYQGFYCSRKCQKGDWEEHKKTCFGAGCLVGRQVAGPNGKMTLSQQVKALYMITNEMAESMIGELGRDISQKDVNKAVKHPWSAGQFKYALIRLRMYLELLTIISAPGMVAAAQGSKRIEAHIERHIAATANGAAYWRRRVTARNLVAAGFKAETLSVAKPEWALHRPTQ